MEVPHELPHRKDQFAEQLQQAFLEAWDAVPRMEQMSDEALEELSETVVCLHMMLHDINITLTDELIFRGVEMPDPMPDEEE
ncbi:hypothetical protein [Rhodococcus sp. HS-D2]|uniref:hypothetical protein n=1 Tax=Rhodococcus sp. HS-D2 TaxID=1384636 RepID=UPI0007DA3D1A|nr:hypothetical protein [Rhodococcus sp. HS-D2]